MTQLTINVPDGELELITYLLAKLKVEILEKEKVEITPKSEVLAGLTEAVVEVKDHLEGNNKLRTMNDFLNEL